MNPAADPPFRRPAPWALILAFTLVYLSWGTTYLAIKEGVKNQQLPPALFGGVRVFLAGLVLLGFLAWRRRGILLPRRELLSVGGIGLLMFVGGNGLITVAEKTVPSGVTAVLAATTPLWMGLLGMLWPRGERLNLRGWLGLVLGLAGVLVLLAPGLQSTGALFPDAGFLLVLGSSLSWALGSLLLRYRRSSQCHFTTAAYQMVIGGGGLALIGLGLGEAGELTADHFTAGAAFAFFYLLIVSSLVGFVAFNWLLAHVPAAQASTYAYVNPVVAILVGWLLGDEELTGWIVGGMLVILTGVALIRGRGHRPGRKERIDDPPYRDNAARAAAALSGTPHAGRFCRPVGSGSVPGHDAGDDLAR
jgi:drug/metabolite transporter (DMT)-like permease